MFNLVQAVYGCNCTVDDELIWACKEPGDKEAAVRSALERLANANAKDNSGYTPLMEPIWLPFRAVELLSIYYVYSKT